MINLLLRILFIIHAGYSMKGGSPAKPEEFKYIASIQKANYHYCSGVIIHKQHIITVAHRIADLTVADLEVVVGSIKLSNRWGIPLLVKEMYLHPGFGVRNVIDHRYDTFLSYEHDIAVLRLEQSLIWSPSVSPIPLVDREDDWGHYLDCILISWDVPKDHRRAILLKWELIKLMGNEVHQQWASYLGKDQKFFSDYFGTTVIAAEDHGSPLVCGDSLTGLVIKGERQSIPGKPSIVMSIAPYLGFIDDIIHDGLFEIEPGKFSYIASIWYKGNYACGGFIVDATHVVTVGHCVIMTYGMSNFTVAVGRPPQWLSLSNITIHPNFKFETTDFPSNWYIEHDVALLTLEKPILWNQWTSPLPLVESDDFHVGGLCELLRWKYDRDEETGAELIKLMTSRVIILNKDCFQQELDPRPQSQVPSFWGRSQYLTPIADHRDAGNPVICDGNPVGFLVQAILFNGKTTAVVARFLKMRSYIELRNLL